ncbi:MAG TPA: acyl--CoA ligase [Pseudogracilibacillus sp.]|nr:acyl--CoA ligase [Pseudogracilibacillus sp.]
MNRNDLIAPEDYNIFMEIERYANDENRKALITETEDGQVKELTYPELIKRTNQVGNAFLNSGLKKGDKILIMVPRIFEAYEVYLAALKTGIVIIPCSEMLTKKDLQYRVTHGEVNGVVSYHKYVNAYSELEEYDQLKRFVIGEAVDGWEFLDELKANASDELAIAKTTRDDIAFLPYTSGTTGNPKGVVHTHSWGFAHLKTIAENWLDIQDGDVVWATAAPGWQKWVWSPFLATLGSGATGFIYNGRFKPQKTLSLIRDYGVNVLCSTPTEYRFLSTEENLGDYKFPELRNLLSAGEALNPEVIDIFKNNFGLDVRDGYGQTENTLLLGIMKDTELRPGSMGKPTPGNDVTVIDDDGNPVPVGEVGDIALKIDSPALFREYYKDPERTKASRRGDYYVTGDRAEIDEDGYFWFEGRNDDIIISSGYTIGPHEVEDTIESHPSVLESAVIASPHKVRGNIVKAYIVLRDSVDQSDALIKEIQDFVKERTGAYKYPREIEFIKELPKTTSGKTRRVALRDLDKKSKQ